MNALISKLHCFACIIIFSSLFTVSAHAQTTSQQLSVNETLYDVEWSPDDNLLAVATASGVRVFDREMEQIAYLQGNFDAVSQLTWQPQGNQIAFIGFNTASIEIWDRDTSTNTFTLSLSFDVAHENISAISWSPYGEKLAILVNDHEVGNPDVLGNIEVWSTRNWTLITTLPRRLRYPPPMLVWDTTSTLIASGSAACYEPEQCSDTPTLQTFDTVSGDRLQNTNIGPYPPQSLVWSPGANIAVSTFTVEVYTASGDHLYESEPYNGLRVQLSWNGDGSLLAMLDDYGHLAIVDPSTNEVLATANTIQDVVALDWNGSANLLAVGNENGVIEFIDVARLLEALPTTTDD